MSKNFLLAFFLYLFGSQSAFSTTITYEVQDLADTTAGEDLWQYAYNISNHNFTADTGFSIYFDVSLYSNLQDPAHFVNADWDILTLQPDLLLPDDGIYDAYALVDNASITDSFTVNFVWLGLNTPTSQSFELYDNSFAVIETGVTQPTNTTPIPEPHGIFLVGLGMMVLLRLHRQKTKTFC